MTDRKTREEPRRQPLADAEEMELDRYNITGQPWPANPTPLLPEPELDQPPETDDSADEGNSYAHGGRPVSANFPLDDRPEDPPG